MPAKGAIGPAIANCYAPNIGAAEANIFELVIAHRSQLSD
jgi:hypothetical protein